MPSTTQGGQFPGWAWTPAFLLSDFGTKLAPCAAMLNRADQTTMMQSRRSMTPYLRSCSPASQSRPATRYPRAQGASAWGLPINIEDLFGAFFGSTDLARGAQSSDFQPPIELRESDEAYILRAELPGLTREDIELEVEDSIVTLRGSKAEESVEEEGELRHRELRFGKFERRIRLREDVNVQEGKARFENGVLRVELPKLKKEDTGTRLEIESA